MFILPHTLPDTVEELLAIQKRLAQKANPGDHHYGLGKDRLNQVKTLFQKVINIKQHFQAS